MAAIAQGVYARGLHGNASSSFTDRFKHVVRPLAKTGCSFFDPRFVANYPFPSYLESGKFSQRGRQILAQVKEFMDDYIYPAEKEVYEYVSKPENTWSIPPIIEELKDKARMAGLWNLFLSGVSGLTQFEYAPMAEEMGRCPFASEVFNCNAPDTGNMEVLYLYGNHEQKEKWLQPLLNGKIRSCFSMSEPDVASSDASNMQCTITRVGNEYEVNGIKWWSSGAGDPRCKVAIVMGVTNPNADRLKRHSMIIVPLDTP
ncbi:PREDICTED: acyl-CoA dehydrogenase family member 11-like, partial [Amphimedon queenslandica]